MLMNKRSQFTKIFSQAILDMKETGILDIFIVEKAHQVDQSCNLLDQEEKPLGYKKLAFLFALLASGTFISLFVALFEFFAEMYKIQKKQESTITIHERNYIDDHITEILDNMSNYEAEKTFQRILQKRIKHSCVNSNEQYNNCDFTKDTTRSWIPVPVMKNKVTDQGHLATMNKYE